MQSTRLTIHSFPGHILGLIPFLRDSSLMINSLLNVEMNVMGISG